MGKTLEIDSHNRYKRVGVTSDMLHVKQRLYPPAHQHKVLTIVEKEAKYRKESD